MSANQQQKEGSKKSTSRARRKSKHAKRRTNEHTKRTEKVKGANCVRSSRDRGMEKERWNDTREKEKEKSS